MRSATKPALREELLRRQAIDQRARRAFAALLASAENSEFRGSDLDPRGRGIVFRLRQVDQDNTRWLHGVVERYGWPTRSMVADDGAAAAWLLVQHADHDPAFQCRCLNLMRALPAEQTNPDHIANLTERVRSKEI